MIIKDCACYGCPECIHCGRRTQYYYTICCDKCGLEADYRVGDSDYCSDCWEEYLNKSWAKIPVEKQKELVDDWDSLTVNEKADLMEEDYEEVEK